MMQQNPYVIPIHRSTPHSLCATIPSRPTIVLRQHYFG
jgi:hypothetical protein